MEHEEAIALLRDDDVEVTVALAHEALEVSWGNNYFDTTHFYEVPNTRTAQTAYGELLVYRNVVL